MAEPKQAKVSEEAADIISRLPNEVLCHIISFLPLKQAVQTSVLSRRWSKVWTSLSILKIVDDFSTGNKVPFVDFVNRVLFYHTGVLDKFWLVCGCYVDFYRADLWIRHALWKKVGELDLAIACRNFDKLPDGVFTCNTLEVLRLRLRYCELKLPSMIWLPSLKCLHLYDIQLLTSGGDSLQSLFSSCPVLEELVIENCSLKRMSEINVFNPSLKRLTLERVYGEDFGIKIDAPSLVYFKCDELKVPKRFVLKNLSSLVEIWMDFATIYRSAAIGLSEGICHVQSLHLFGGLLEDFLQASAPEFPKVTYLSLDDHYSYLGWDRFLPDLLSCCPSLKALEVNVTWSSIEKAVTTPSGERFPPQLKTLKISSFQGYDVELEKQVVQYFLMNAHLLEECTIRTGRSYMTNELRSKIAEKVLELPKISKNCKILVV